MTLPISEPRNVTELDTFQRARAGDVSAFEQLLRGHERIVLRLAMRLTGNLQDAQDVAQEVFLKLHRELKRFHDADSVAPWLYRVTVNASFDSRRRRKRSRLTSIGQDWNNWRSEQPTPEAMAQTRQEEDLLQAGMSTLSERERAAIALRELQGLSTAEVAQILGSTESTVRVQISAARIKLRKFFEKVRGQKP